MSATASVLEDAAIDGEMSSRSIMSYNVLKEVLQTGNIDDDEEAVMVTRMRVDPRHVKEFERILRLILKNTHTIGHVSTCVVKPPPGEFTYTSIVKYSSLNAMRQIYPSTAENGGLDFYKLLAARDSLLLEPPTYQIEAGFGTWIESDGHTRPMRDDSDDRNLAFNTIPQPGCDDSCDNPHGLNVRSSFVAPTKHFQLFQPRYQRNNKKGGQKNLRCFPCCRNGRHVSSGFCGDSIRVHVAVSRITVSGGIKICPISPTTPAVLAYARFLNLEGAFDPTVSGPEVFPGQTIEKHELLSYVRDKDHPLNPLFPGILRGAAMESTMQSAIFEFNAECKAWHYGWTAPRGQGVSGSDAQHVLEILFVKPMGSYMFCLERLRSDAFSIYSSRRASHAPIKPEAEPYENDDDVDDDRGQKRKRALAPPSPVVSASSIASSPRVWTPSLATQLHAHNHSHEHNHNHAHENHNHNHNHTSPWHAAPATNSFVSPHETLGEMAFKVEPAASPSASSQTQAQPQQQPHQHQQQQQQNYASDTLDSLMVSTPMYDQHFHGSNGVASALDIPLLSESGDLVDHMLFGEHGARRVVSSEELPWSELYNLFDNVPTVFQGDDANDMDDDSPVSSPTPSHDSAAATSSARTSSVGAAAILTYL